MGLLNFVKDAGEKVWDAVAGNHTKKSVKLKEYIQKWGLPGADNVNIDVADDKATVTGENINQEVKEKNFGGDW